MTARPMKVWRVGPDPENMRECTGSRWAVQTAIAMVRKHRVVTIVSPDNEVFELARIAR